MFLLHQLGPERPLADTHTEMQDKRAKSFNSLSLSLSLSLSRVEEFSAAHQTLETQRVHPPWPGCTMGTLAGSGERQVTPVWVVVAAVLEPSWNRQE